MNELIECKTCGKAIASLAEACPSCGAPNDWLHPDIAHFLSIKDATGISRPFNYTTTKTTVSGQTAAKPPVWAWVIAAMISGIAAFLFMLSGFLWAFIVGVFAAVVLNSTRRFDHFHADVANRSWTSSNDRFWKPVRVVLKL